MSYLWIFAALGTAVCFAVSSLIAYDAARALGAVTFSFVRMTTVAIGFLAWVLIVGFDEAMHASDVGLLVLSGFLGVFLADTLRYSSLARIGPQLQSLLNTTAAPFALLLGFLILGQVVSGISLLGTLIVFAGIVVAIAFRSNAAPNKFDGDKDATGVGVVFGLASALMQAGSVLIAAPVMLKGIDPISATVVRAAAGSASLLLPVVLSSQNRLQIRSMNGAVAKQVFLSAVIGTGLGMTLQLYALSNGSVGIVSTLSATVPLIILPLVWILGKSRPTKFAWFGAILGVVGVWLIVSRSS